MIKNLLLITSLIVTISCNSRNESSAQSKSFDLFISHFQSIQLPFIIETEQQFPYYMKYDSVTYTHYRDTTYKNIATPLLQFLHEDSSKVSQYSYRFGKVLFKNEDALALIYLRDSLDKDGDLDNTWLFLSTYKRTGELINRITLGGYYFDNIYQFCSINANLYVTTRNFKYIADDTYESAFKSRLKQIDYQITEKGIIKKLTVSDTIKYFRHDKIGRYVDYVKKD